LKADPENTEAKKILEKIQNRIDSEKEEAFKIASKITEEQESQLKEQKKDAQVLSELLEKDIVQTDQQEQEFHNLLGTGKSLYKKKRYEEAVESWEQASLIKPKNTELKDLLEKARNKIQEEREIIRVPEAGLTAEKQIELERLMAQGEEEFSNLNYGHAIQTFEKVLELDAQNLIARRYLARAKNNQRTYVEEGGSPEDIVMTPKGELGDLGVLSLSDALQIGFANHLPSKIAQEEVLLARMRVGDAKRGLFPKAKVRWKETSGTTTGEDFEGREYSLDLQQNIYAGGKFRITYNQARVNLAVARKNYEKTKEEFTFELTQAYYNFVFAKQKIKNKEELLKKMKDLLGIAEKQYGAQAVTLSEILEMRSQNEEVLFQKQQILNDVDLAKLALVQLLSLPHGTVVDVLDIPDPLDMQLNAEDLIQVAYKNRRDYQVKKLLVLFNKYALEIAKRNDAVNVELTGSLGQRDEYFTSEQINLEDEYYLGVKVSKPLGSHVLELNGVTQDRVPQVGQTTATKFNSQELALRLWEQRTATTVTEANINYHRALSELENAKRSLVHDIHSSLYSVIEAGSKIKNERASVQLGLEDLRSTRAKQQVDQATIVQVMRSEAKAWNTKTDLVSAQADYYISIARLNKDLGVYNYIDPSSGVVATDKEGLAPGIRLLVSEKSKKKSWYQLLSIEHGVPSYYPDEVVTDVLREKQQEEISRSPKKLFGIFGSKKEEDSEYSEYKVYEEKYRFTNPQEDKKSWFPWGGSSKKLDDDYSSYYKDNKEYEQAFSAKSDVSDSEKKWFQFWKKEKPQTVDLESLQSQTSLEQSQEEKDGFEPFLGDKQRIVFAEYHVEDSKFETVFAIRSNAPVGTSIAWLENPTRLVISFKEEVISALPAFAAVNKGAMVSLKTLQKKVPLPSEYQGWSKILSLVIELDAKHEYVVLSESDVFKVTIKK
jgi:outer membrane protein TolC/Flp pilus assembly protein TadD